MQNSPDRISLVAVPIPMPRGVHSYVEPSGLLAYIATTSTGALLNGEIRHRLPEETDAMIRDEMWKDLDRQDPIRDAVTGRPQLSVSSGGARRSRRGLSRPG
jgi:hypothetical protein